MFVHLLCYSHIYLFWLGGRIAPEIVSWLNKKTDPPATELKSEEEVKEFIDKRNVAVVGFFTDKKSDLAKAFISAAVSIDDIEFGITEPSFGGEYGITGVKIVLFKKASFLLC